MTLPRSRRASSVASAPPISGPLPARPTPKFPAKLRRTSLTPSSSLNCAASRAMRGALAHDLRIVVADGQHHGLDIALARVHNPDVDHAGEGAELELEILFDGRAHRSTMPFFSYRRASSMR